MDDNESSKMTVEEAIRLKNLLNKDITYDRSGLNAKQIQEMEGLTKEQYTAVGQSLSFIKKNWWFFPDAFNSRNMKMMAENWAQSDEIAMDNPLGSIKRGWSEIKAVYESIFNGPAEVHVEYYDYTIQLHKDCKLTATKA
ncbi:MAG: hypothetical protein M0Z71_14495 [Nitrospiraceae bacterium]|nr:hypothetical protein [Nitrospiraceae bacterium]